MITALLKYTIPVVSSRLASVLLNIFATVIVGYLGVDDLAAYGFSNAIYLAFYLMSIAYLLVFSVRAAQLKDKRKLFSQYLVASFFFGLGLSLLLIFVFVFILPLFLPLLGQAPIIIEKSDEFFLFIAFGMPPLMCSVIMNQLFVVLKRSRFILINSFVQLLIGVFFVYLFAYYYHLGLEGVGLGIAVAYWIKAATFFVYLRLYCQSEFQFKQLIGKNFFKDMIFLFRLGWPVSFQYGGELLATTIATIMIGHLSTRALAAQQTAIQLRVFFIMLPFALSQACVILIAKKVGELKEARKYIHVVFSSALKIGLLLMFVFLLIINVFCDQYIALFIHHASAAMEHLVRTFVLITSVALMIDVVKYVVMGVLRALEDTKNPMKYSLCIYWLIGIPLAYLLGYHTTLNTVGVRLGMLLGLALSVFTLIVYYRHFIRHKIPDA